MKAVLKAFFRCQIHTNLWTSGKTALIAPNSAEKKYDEIGVNRTIMR